MPPRLKEDFLKLVEKYLNGNASPGEIDAIERYYAHFSDDPDITTGLNEAELDALKAGLSQQIKRRIIRLEKPVTPLYKKRSFQVAASILLVLSIGLFVVDRSEKAHTKLHAQNYDLPPGGNRATLTLANGSKIDLSKTKNGTLSSQSGSYIIKQNDQLRYSTGADPAAAPVSYNTLSTPKGGQYQLTLADGTRVWLNAASSLKFPTAFTGSERMVELTGEAYFEVAHNSKQPFKVKSAGQTVEDIGTQFDINAYADEDAVTTTLVEGSVKILDGQKETMIKPGEQYLLKSNHEGKVESDVDLDEVTAWKNGMFQFDNADIKTIMRQVSRWYNVDVVYQGQIPASTYHGRLSRNSNASVVLRILELSGINFTIERGKIIVK